MLIPKNLYLLTLQLEGEALDGLNSYRKARYPQGFNRIPIHLTLVPRFHIACEYDEFLETLENWVRHYSWPLPLALDGVDIDFPQARHVVVGICPNSDLQERQNRLFEVIQPCVEFPPNTSIHPQFVPHISIIKVPSPQERSDHLVELNRMAQGQPVLTRGLLLWRMDAGRWLLEYDFLVDDGSS